MQIHPDVTFCAVLDRTIETVLLQTKNTVGVWLVPKPMTCQAACAREMNLKVLVGIERERE